MNDSIVSQKIAQSKAIEEQVKTFLKKGGKVTSDSKYTKNDIRFSTLTKDQAEKLKVKFDNFRE